MKLRCLLDNLVLDAFLRTHPPNLVAMDGEEPFALEALEAIFYELVSATRSELLGLEQIHFRLLRRAADFRTIFDQGCG